VPLDYGDIMDLMDEQGGTWIFIASASCPYHNKTEEVAAW